MKLRLKTVTIIALAMAGIFLLLAAVSYDLIVGRFDRLEKETARRDVERVGELLQARLDDLGKVALDNGKWDASCRFIEMPDETYVNEVVIDTSKAYNIDLWLMFDQSGKLAYGKAFSGSERVEAELPQEALHKIGRLWPDLQNSGSGILLLEEGAVLIGYHPIEKSDGLGPRVGLLVVGRNLQGGLLDELSKQAKLEVKVKNKPLTQISFSGVQFVEREHELLGKLEVLDLTRQDVVQLTAKLPRPISRQGQEVFYYFLGCLVAVLSSVLLIVFRLLDKTVLQRLLKITQLVRDIKKQEDCRNRLPEQGDDELTSLSASINMMLHMLEESFDRVQASNNALGNLLNNAGQGILTFAENRLVDAAYSVECLRFFSGSIAQKDICRLLFPSESLRDQEERNFLAHAIQRIFEEYDVERRNVFLSLLPEEIELQGKKLAVRYKMIIRFEDGAAKLVMMLIITDVTEKRQLEAQFQTERKVLKMVIAARLNYNDLSECIQEFRLFCRRELPEAFADNIFVEKRLAEMLHYIHTFKGKFAQFNLINLDEKLHGLEQELIDLRESGATKEDYRIVLDGDKLQKWLEEDLRILKRFLGERFFAAAEMFNVPKQELLAIEKKVLQNMSRFDSQWLLPQLRRLRYRPFADLLASYPEYAATMAERFGRQLAQMRIEGGEFMVNPQHYRGFANALVHVIKNALEHGLETPEERRLSGKSEKGLLRCSIKLKGGQLQLLISDDGRGIDPEKIRTKALEKGIYSAEKLAVLNEQELLELIFRDDFTTQTEISSLSGRGIGLAAVKKEVDKLGGKIVLKNNPGQGTTFLFYLPYDEQEALTPQVSVEVVLEPLVEAAKEHLSAHAMLKGFTEKYAKTQGVIRLLDVSAFIAVKGSMQGMFITSFNEALLHRMTETLPPEVRLSLREEETWEGVVAESANVILGNSLMLLPSSLKSILIDTPITLLQKGKARVGYPNREIWSCRLQQSELILDVYYIALEEKRVNDL